MLRKLGKSNQVAIPKEIISDLGLKQNDYLDIYISDNKVVLEPKLLISKDQAYFYTAEWQIGEREAEKDIKEGRVTKTRDIDELFNELDK
jgi:AbrB family looped-hinge helix DNA binding protein